MAETISKYRFMDDYSEGGHPDILAALSSTNLSQQTAYGDDEYCVRARALIAKRCGADNLAVHFVTGGTLANITITASALRSHEAIVSAESGHIALHETGAIEAAGHKIISVPTADGKLSVEAVSNAVSNHSFAPHMAKPRLVYLSNATELGTVYTREELADLSAYCREHQLLLMLDGARLGVALASTSSTLTLEDIATLTDVFWIGGTKAGALIGEAIVIPNAELAHEFAFNIKQRGALLAKGRVLGIQFQQLFSDGLFDRLALRANSLAAQLSVGIVERGHSLYTPTDCNQVFAVLPNSCIETLEETFQFHRWQAVDSATTVVRLVTSWATDETQILRFLDALQTKG